MRVRVRVVAELKSTEDPEKVMRALTKLFPTIRFKLKSVGQRQFIEGESEELGSLSYLKENLRRRKVRAAAERIMHGFSGEKLVSSCSASRRPTWAQLPSSNWMSCRR